MRGDVRTNGANSSSFRTVRPTAAGVQLLTVRQVVALPEVMVGSPEVLAAPGRLDHPVRWAHVLDGPTVEGMLSGQELVLSTGVGWPPEEELGDYVAALAKAKVAGLVLELGSRYSRAPGRLVQACRELGIPLVLLRRQVRFVSITEAVHRRVLVGQMEALEARDRVHALVTEFIRTGAPVDHVIHEVSRLLRSPVVLEDLSHRVVAYSSFDKDTTSLLARWRDRSRVSHERGNPDRHVAAVEARGRRWGYLIALREPGYPSGTDFVLEQAAVALSLGRAAGHGSDDWLQLGHRKVLEDLVRRRFSTTEDLSHRLEATGLALRDRYLVGIAATIRPPREQGGSPDVPGVCAAVLSAATSMEGDAICSQVDIDPPVLLVALSFPRGSPGADSWTESFATPLATMRGGGLGLAVGATATDTRGLVASIEEALELLGLTDTACGTTTGTIIRAHGHELPLLLNRFGDDPAVQEYVERVLGPLLAYDARHGSDLFDVLTAYLRSPGNRTRAAADIHLSRSVFYQRLALIEKLLGRSLEDGHQIATLYGAVLAHRRLA